MQQTGEVAQIHKSVEDLVYFVAHKFRRRFGGDIEDLIGEANLAFVRAVNGFDRERGFSFNSYLYAAIWNSLLKFNSSEREQEMDSLDAIFAAGGQFVAQLDREFDVDGFANDLPSDVKLIFKLIIQAPADLTQAVILKGNEYRNWRSCLQDYLRQNFGWTARRVRENFREIERVLA